MKRIVLIVGKPAREAPIMASIKKEILDLAPQVEVRVWERFSLGLSRNVMGFKPDVILTTPFNAVGLSRIFYLFKFLLKCKIISLTDEGVVDFNVQNNVAWAVGMDRYGKNLVDYEIFWGPKMARVIGGRRLALGRMSSAERNIVIGYPRLQSYFTNAPSDLQLPSRVQTRLASVEKKNVLLFITGFQLANYTKEDLFNAGDLDAENKCDELLVAVERAKKYRQEWIEQILIAANENKDMLVVVKKHPVEKLKDYPQFENVDNILHVYEDCELQAVMQYAGLFIHYGSTSLVDAYLLRLPSVYVYAEGANWYTDLGWPSSIKSPLHEIRNVIKEYKNGLVKFEHTPQMQQIMFDMFNIEIGKPYNPSKTIAELLLADDPPLHIPLTDRYLWRALAITFYYQIKNLAGRIVCKVLPFLVARSGVK